MATQPITSDWRIDLDPEFRRRTDGGDLVLWKPGRTVYATVFKAGSAEADEAINRLLEARRGEVMDTYDRLEPGLVGHAYLLPEGNDKGRYWGLNTWVTCQGSVVCVTFYFDDAADLPWALDAWLSVRRDEGAGRPLPN